MELLAEFRYLLVGFEQLLVAGIEFISNPILLVVYAITVIH
jgi:hypothetical protein